MITTDYLVNKEKERKPVSSQERILIHDVINCARQTLLALPPEARVQRLQGIGILYRWLGEPQKARFALETAAIIRESEQAQHHFQSLTR